MRIRPNSLSFTLLLGALAALPPLAIDMGLPPLPTPRHGLGSSAVGNRIFVFGGGTQTGGNAATAIHEVLGSVLKLQSLRC